MLIEEFSNSFEGLTLPRTNQQVLFEITTDRRIGIAPDPPQQAEPSQRVGAPALADPMLRVRRGCSRHASNKYFHSLRQQKAGTRKLQRLQ